MGHRIHAGSTLELEIAWSNGAWQIVSWCDSHWDAAAEEEYKNMNFGRDWNDRDSMGTTYIPNRVVQAADAAVPMIWTEAVRGGFIDSFGGKNEITEDDFETLRAFLRRAAADGRDISGSY